MPVSRPPASGFGGALAGAEIKSKKGKKPGTRSWLYPDKSFIPQSGKAGQVTQPESAEAETDRIVAEMLAELGYARDSARREAEKNARNEVLRAQQLSQALQTIGMPQLIQGIYQNSGQSLAGMAGGFSEDVQGLASEQAAVQGNILAGTGQEGAIRNEGQAMGDVLYGQHGFIPARGLEQTGAAFASEAALQPGFALQFGNMAASGVMKDFQDEILGKFADDEALIRSKRPGILADAKDRQAAKRDAKKQEAYDLYAAGLITQRELGRRLGLKGWKKLPDALAGEESDIKIQEVDGNLVAIDMKTGKVQVVYEGAKERDLKTVQLSDGRDVVIDMATGKIVQTIGGPKPKDNQIRGSQADGYTIFDSEGNVIGKVKGTEKPDKPDPLWKQNGFKSAADMNATARKLAKDTQGKGTDKYGKPLDEDFVKPTGQEALDQLIAKNIPPLVAWRALKKYYPGLKRPKGDPGGAVNANYEGPASLAQGLWPLFGYALEQGFTNLGTHNAASRLPGGGMSDHASYPANAFDLGFSGGGGFKNKKARAMFWFMTKQPGVEYVILGDKIWSRSRGLHAYTSGGHDTHIHVSGSHGAGA